MSGGSMNYLYQRIEWDATFKTNTPERRAFRKHLMLVARCLKAIEWNDSGDGCDEEDALLLECLGKQQIIDDALEHAKESVRVLQKTIAKMENT